MNEFLDQLNQMINIRDELDIIVRDVYLKYSTETKMNFIESVISWEHDHTDDFDKRFIWFEGLDEFGEQSTDQLVIEWFIDFDATLKTVQDKALAKKKQIAEQAVQAEIKHEQRERKEYERLKKKYDNI